MVNEVYKPQNISRMHISYEDVVHVRLRKLFIISLSTFEIPDLVSKPRKPVFIIRTGPSTTVYIVYIFVLCGSESARVSNIR